MTLINVARYPPSVVCVFVYIAANFALPDGPPWKPESPSFHIRPLGDHEDGVRASTPRHYIAYLGAHTGCGCGFLYDPDEPEAAIDRELLLRLRPEEAADYVHAMRSMNDDALQRRAGFREFKDFVRTASLQGPVELLVFGGEKPLSGLRKHLRIESLVEMARFPQRGLIYEISPDVA